MLPAYDDRVAELGITGEEIRVARERAGLTQAELAALVGVAPRTVGNWERGENPPGKNLARLRDILRPVGNDTHGPGSGLNGEPTLHGASDAQLIAELAYRLGRAAHPAV